MSSWGAPPMEPPMMAPPFLQRDLAGFWIRAGATIIDGLILFIPNLIIVYLVHSTTSSLAGNVIGWLVDGIFCIGFWVFNSGRTPGDIACGLQVIREDGSPISFGTALTRYVMLIVGSYAILLGLLWVIWDPQKQGWHDKAAGTLVTRV